jgi:hypothetical protein
MSLTRCTSCAVPSTRRTTAGAVSSVHAIWRRNAKSLVRHQRSGRRRARHINPADLVPVPTDQTRRFCARHGCSEGKCVCRDLWCTRLTNEQFQYMALARYSQKVHHRWKAAEEKHAAAAQGLGRERKHRKQLHEDLSRARLQTIDDAAALAKSQAAVKKWEARVPVINSLITAIKPMKEFVLPTRNT